MHTGKKPGTIQAPSTPQHTCSNFGWNNGANDRYGVCSRDFLSRITKAEPFLIQDCASRGHSQTTETILEIGGDYSIVFKMGQN